MRRLTVMTLLAMVAAPLLAEPVTIIGRVVGPDGKAIEGAVVGTPDRIRNLYPPEWVDAVTDENGRFVLAVGIDDARESDSRPIGCVAEGRAVGGGYASPGEQIVMRLIGDARQVSGAVVGLDGEPIAGATVTLTAGFRGPMPEDFSEMPVEARSEWHQENYIYLYGWDRAPSATTAADGTFSIGGIAAGGGGSLTVSAPGYVEEAATASPDGAPLVVTLQPEAVISGRVTLDGEPVEGAEVGLAPGMVTLRGSASLTARDGRYEITGIRAGRWTVRVESGEDYAAAQSNDLQIKPGEHLEGVDIALNRGVLAEGFVTWEGSGEPVADAEVRVVSKALRLPRLLHTSRTDETGRFALRLVPGDYHVSGGGGSGVWALNGPQNFTVADDGAPLALELRAVRQPTITVQVLYPDGTPAAGIDVLVSEETHRMSREEPLRLTADAQGRIAVAATARSRSGEGGWHPTLSVLVQDEARGLAAATHLTSGGEHELTLTEAGWIGFTIRDGQGRPHAGASFDVHFKEHQSRLVLVPPRSDEEGRVLIGPLPEGLEVRLQPSDAVRWTMSDLDWPGMRTMSVPAGDTVLLDDLVVHPAGLTARGIVVDTEGDPVAGALVTASERIDRDAEPAVSGEDGRWELARLQPGYDSYLIVATDGTRAVTQLCDPRVALDVVLDLQPAGSAHGVLVRAEDGEPVGSMQVTLFGPGLQWELPGDLGGEKRSTTDAEGRWRIGALVPGVRYYASVLAPLGEGGVVGSFMVYGDEGPITLTMPLPRR